MTAQRLQHLAVKVYQPKRCNTYAEVSAAIEEWEINLSSFDKADKKADLNETTKLFGLRQILPDELEKDIAKSSSVLKKYDAVKKYVYEQVAVRRDVERTYKKGQFKWI